MQGLKETFDTLASRYDDQRRWIIPDLEGFYHAAVRAVALRQKSPSILDIGAGTGLLSGLLLEAYPGARITLLDISEKMMGVAKARFRRRKGIRFVAADYRRRDLGGPFDAICSALSIHHLEREEKRELYRKVFGALKRGGVFVNADEVAGESDAEQRENLASWDDFLRNGPLGREEVEEIIRRRETFDRMEMMSVQVGWMREIGFTDVDVIYKNRSFTFFMGR
jgi:tRNA (cmo5U34)-methyltransferase